MLYIFNKDDILLEVLNLDDIEEDTMDRQINSTYKYEIKLDINLSKNLIKENKLGFFDLNDEFQLFIIKEITDTIYSDDIKELYCIHDYYSTNSHIITDKRIVNGTCLQSITKALEDTNYNVGIIGEFATNIDINFYYISSWKALNDTVEKFEGEIRPRIEFNEDNTLSKYIDILNRLGEDSGIRFTYDTNVKQIKRNIADEEHYNVLYGRGSSLPTTDETGEETGGYTRLIDFEDVSWSVANGDPCDKPSGQKYVEDLNSIKKYGRLEGIYENKDISDTTELLQVTYNKLQETKEPNVSYEADVEDIQDIEGYEHYSYSLGDTVIILDDDYDIDFESRIIQEKQSIKNKTRIITMGYILPSMSDKNSYATVGDNSGSSDKDDTIKDENFPNTLPDPPILTVEREGFASVSLVWTYENKTYYIYEIYASQLENFNPTQDNLIFKGNASAFLHEVNFNQTWYYRARCTNTHGQSTAFSDEVSATTYKIQDGTEIFENAAIKEALIESLNADKITAGKVKGTYIDARNLTVKDGNDNVTFSVSSAGIVEIIQGLIDISDEGIRINLEDNEDNIVGYVVYDGQGVQIFTNDDEPISSFHREGSYTQKMVTDKLVCPSVVQVADTNGCPTKWYIAPVATGDKTGRDENNKADSLNTVLRNIRNYGSKFENTITINIEEGCILNENSIVIQDFMGTVIQLNFGANVVINCEYFNIEDLSSRIFLHYISDKRLVAGEITQANYNKYPVINGTSDDAVMNIRHTNYAEIMGIRIQGVEGATGIKAVAASNVVVDNCDFYGVYQCMSGSGQSKISLGWSSGCVEKLASIYNGAIFTSSRRIPKYSSDEMVYVAENAIFIPSQYSYTQFDSLHQVNSSTEDSTNLNDAFTISTENLYTMVEGSGKQTTARKGYTGQGRYKNLKAHRGYVKLPISGIKSVMANKKSYELQLRLTRLNTEHGYNSKTPHPIIRATGGSSGATGYWDSNVKFSRGETQVLTLPSDIVQAIENGADTLELWASSNQEQQYAFFGDVAFIVEGENKVKEDDNKPGEDVGTGETAYNATGTTTANLNVRTGAGTNYSIITTLPQGTKVTIVAKDNTTGWYKISYNGAYGYVSNAYVTINSTGTTVDPTIIQDFPYADEMIEVGLTYWRVCDNEYIQGQSWSQGLTYRSSNTPLSGTCEVEQDVDGSLWVTVTYGGQTRHYKAIDCSTFSGVVTKGLEYANGPYANKTNFTNFRKDKLQKSDKKWAFNMVKADGSLAREAAAQAEYFDRVGLGIVYYRNVDTGKTYGSKGSSTDNFAPIKKGDLIFYAKKDSSGNYKQPNRYMKISHVSICYGDNSSGKKAVIESTNGTMSKNHTFDNGSSINAGVRIVSIEGDYGYSDDIVMVVRPQPSHYNGTLPGGSTGDTTGGDGVIDTGTTEYTNCVSEQGTIDGNKYIYKLKTCKITAYGGDSGSACNIPLNLGKTCGSFNLPYGTKVYIPSMKGYTFTDGNGKTVTCDGIFTVNDTGVGGTDFDLYMSTKSDTNAENIFGNTRREDVYILSYGSGYGYAWSYTQSYEWAYNHGGLTPYKTAFKDYIKYGGTLINFLKFKSNDANIRSSKYWSILNS